MFLMAAFLAVGGDIGPIPTTTLRGL